MVQKKYEVRLSSEEKRHLRKVVRSGRSSAQAITRARILLKVEECWTAAQVATALDISERTVIRARKRHAQEGWRRLCTGTTRSTGTGSWTNGWKLISLPWPALRRPKATTTGPCGCWRGRRWNWDWWNPCPTRRCGCI